MCIRDRYNEVEKAIEVPRRTLCKTCGGEGGTKKTCAVCSGTGSLTREIKGPNFLQKITSTCTNCIGSGSIIKDKCKLCNGTGELWKREKVKLKLSQKMIEYDGINMEGLGDENKHGKSDLIVTIDIVQEGKFKVENRALFYSEDIKIEDILTGGKHEIELPNGKKIIADYDKSCISETKDGGKIFKKMLGNYGFNNAELFWTGKIII